MGLNFHSTYYWIMANLTVVGGTTRRWSQQRTFSWCFPGYILIILGNFSSRRSELLSGTAELCTALRATRTIRADNIFRGNIIAAFIIFIIPLFSDSFCG